MQTIFLFYNPNALKTEYNAFCWTKKIQAIDAWIFLYGLLWFFLSVKWMNDYPLITFQDTGKWSYKKLIYTVILGIKKSGWWESNDEVKSRLALKERSFRYLLLQEPSRGNPMLMKPTESLSFSFFQHNQSNRDSSKLIIAFSSKSSPQKRIGYQVLLSDNMSYFDFRLKQIVQCDYISKSVAVFIPYFLPGHSLFTIYERKVKQRFPYGAKQAKILMKFPGTVWEQPKMMA